VQAFQGRSQGTKKSASNLFPTLAFFSAISALSGVNPRLWNNAQNLLDIAPEIAHSISIKRWNM
jgi:hypothetical protein